MNKKQRFQQTFSKLSQQKQGAFVPFVVLGDPNFDCSFHILCTLIDNGADALELGFPSSNPSLDGEVIQGANQRALQAEISTDNCFQLLTKIREKYPNIAISLLLYSHIIIDYGMEKFYQKCAKSDIDAVLIPDICLSDGQPFYQTANKYDIQSVQFCMPTADKATIKQIAQQSQGYVYLVSRTGVTSADDQTQATNLTDLIEQLKANNSAPILQGFGIATPQQVTKALNNGCMGAISGSAVVKIIENNLENQMQMLDELKLFITTMKNATKLK